MTFDDIPFVSWMAEPVLYSLPRGKAYGHRPWTAPVMVLPLRAAHGQISQTGPPLPMDPHRVTSLADLLQRGLRLQPAHTHPCQVCHWERPSRNLG